MGRGGARWGAVGRGGARSHWLRYCQVERRAEDLMIDGEPNRARLRRCAQRYIYGK